MLDEPAKDAILHYLKTNKSGASIERRVFRSFYATQKKEEETDSEFLERQSYDREFKKIRKLKKFFKVNI